MNQITHWLDLSQVYGSSFRESKRLRLFEGGKLAFSEGRGLRKQPLLPINKKDKSGICGTQGCFFAGKVPCKYKGLCSAQFVFAIHFCATSKRNRIMCMHLFLRFCTFLFFIVCNTMAFGCKAQKRSNIHE